MYEVPSYLVCIPLGVFKAIRHGSRFDWMSSALVFIGYSIPGWALGTALLVFLGGGSFWSLFPLGGFRPGNWEDLNVWAKITGQIHYMFLPVVCYMVGSFATDTILTKRGRHTLARDVTGADQSPADGHVKQGTAATGM